jgi:hypothetical protein
VHVVLLRQQVLLGSTEHMPRDEIPTSLQESILAALLFNEKAGAAVAAQVTPALFDESYREIAERALGYRRRYGKPPGLTHLDDLFGKLLSPGRAPRLRRAVFELAELAEGLNGDYVVARTQEFIRDQKLKTALVEANGRYEQGGENRTEEVENILSAALRYRSTTLGAGTFLSDTKRSLKFFDRGATGISFGIPIFDQMGLVLAPKEQTLLIGPKGSGKTWSCVHVGAQGLLQRQRVLHLSLEMDEPYVTARYYQKLFAAARRPDKFDKTILEFDRMGRLAGFRTRKTTPRWDFSSSTAKRELLKRVQRWGTRLDRLVVKYFPSGQLTMSQLEGYLDYLEAQHNFVPTLLIVDYPDLMKQDSKDLRISLGQTFVNLRGIAGDRNMALFTPTQGGRLTIGAKRTRSKDVTEDISKVFTADTTITYQRTEAEKRMGLARLSVEHSRGTSDGSTIIITQSYSTGQWVLQSSLMQDAYWQRMKEVTGEASDD